MAEYNT